ncbi:transcription repressor OFP7 [Silene latifolia]|uniref:transcription repressor OFP7 n=1 Tax=Silene latifolia TaxID=37657 RepID=UPI003D78676E
MIYTQLQILPYKMRKGFIKFKVSKLISSFKSCRSKHPSSLPSNPEPYNHRLTNSHIRRSHDKPYKAFSLKRHVSSAISSARRSFSISSPRTSTHFRWEKQPHWHVIAKIHNYDSTPPRSKIYNSSASEDVLLLPSPPTKHKRRSYTKRKRNTYRKSRTSVSSDSGHETPVSPARLSEFMRKMIPPCRAEDEVVEGKVRESYAVVKRSDDPYNDFWRSMAEMVVEKNMFERKDMQELLRCFLSLNSESLHGVIVAAFVDIWDALFPRSSTSDQVTEPEFVVENNE